MRQRLLDSLNRLLNPLRQRVALMISRAVVALVSDGEALQRLNLNVLSGEIQTGIERWQNFGFTGHPLPGTTEAVVLYIGGDRDHPVVVAADSPTTRPTDVPAGGSAQYDVTGGRAELDAAGNWTVEALLKSTLKTPEVVLGSGSVTEKIINGETFQATYNAHMHNAFGVQTTPPTVLSSVADLSQAVKAATLQV